MRVIPTARREKLPKGFSYLLGAQAISGALGDLLQLDNASLIPIVLVCVALVTEILEPNSTLSADGAATNSLSKEVILHEDGKDRHWLVKSNGVIIEEHGLTAHGDLHVLFEYPTGVRAPQIDAPAKDTNIQSVATMFWRGGTRMSRTPLVGEIPNGQDFLWWPNGKMFREARFVMGTPVGVWKYYDRKGGRIGEGVFQDGKRKSGMFIGGNRAGYFFFFTSYPIKQQQFENGVLKEEMDFLKEPISDEK